MLTGWCTILVQNHQPPLSGSNTQHAFCYSLNTMRFAKIIPCVILVLAAILPFSSPAQSKSSNIQVIDGKKYYIHKIEKSQSLYAISKLYGITLEDIYSLNPEAKKGTKINQEIKILFTGPAPVAENTAQTPAVDTLKYFTHKVSKGETVYSIIKKFNLSEKQLNDYNPTLTQGLKEGQLIVTGEKIKKKISAKEQKEKEKEREKENKQHVIVKEIKPSPPAADSSLIKPVSKPKKTSYNIGLILPFQLESTIALDLQEMDKNTAPFPMLPGLSIDFYLGFKRAVDSLTSKDFEVSIDLFDIDDKDSLKLIELAASQRFRELDLVFGPLYANGFKVIAKKAKELHIPVVSPLATQNKVLYNNIYVSKTNPSQFTLLEALAAYCLDSLKSMSAPVLISFNDKDKKEAQFVAAFKKYYNEHFKQSGRPAKDSIILAKGMTRLKPLIASGSHNLIVTLSNNPVFLTDFITQLSLQADKKNLVLCGWQNISEQDNIDQEYLNLLNFTFPCQFNISNKAAYKPLYDWYRSQQETVPAEYFFVGFDIAYYYLSNLRDKGPDFVHTLNTLPLETNYMNFKFTRPDNATGFDNCGAYIFKYNNYHLVKTGWK